MSLRATHSCWICDRPVQLENCKIDERGKPVHEDCYAAKLVVDKATGSLPVPTDTD
jgi:hypothetical protein